MLTRFKKGASNLVWDIVTGDETWIYCYDLKTNSNRRYSEGEFRSLNLSSSLPSFRSPSICYPIPFQENDSVVKLAGARKWAGPTRDIPYTQRNQMINNIFHCCVSSCDPFGVPFRPLRVGDNTLCTAKAVTSRSTKFLAVGVSRAPRIGKQLGAERKKSFGA
ncbi:hypothetical protein EVAR_3520_1 [Eumeta japonica]|uniref:Mariner Mos1 transposase n=1 Tax=Eumeta variegata TaxID=151549 RepID=A0A4C1SW24_EUMVA|nr:hypothetical protein EVAR_3520_1 [Eumeta japonica]